MMSGLGFDYIIKKIALFLIEYSLVISALFIGEKLIIEYITKKIAKGFYSNIFLNFKLSRVSTSFFIGQIILVILIIYLSFIILEILSLIHN